MPEERRYFLDIERKEDLAPGHHIPGDSGNGTADVTVRAASKVAPGLATIATSQDVDDGNADRVVDAQELLRRINLLEARLPQEDAQNPRLEGAVPQIQSDDVVRWVLAAGGGGGGGLSEQQVRTLINAIIQAQNFVTTSAQTTAIANAINGVRAVDDVTYEMNTQMITVSYRDGRDSTTIDLSALAGGGDPTFTARLSNADDELTLTVGSTTHVIGLSKYVNNNADGVVIDNSRSVTLSSSTSTNPPPFTLSIPIRNDNGTMGSLTVDLAPLRAGLSGGGTGTTEARVNQLIQAALDAYTPVDQTARDGNIKSVTFINNLLTITTEDDSTYTATITGTGGGGTADGVLQSATLDKTNNRIRFALSNGANVDLSGTDIINMTPQQISDALFNTTATALMNFEDQSFPITGGDFTDQGGGQIDRTLGTLTPAQATAITNGTVTRVSGTITWTVGAHESVEPSAQAEIRYGGQRIGGITLIDEQEISFNFQITPNAVANATGRAITVTAIARTRGGAAPNSNLSITNAQLHLPGPGYQPVETIAIAAAQHATAPLGVKIADNLDAIHQNTARISANLTAINTNRGNIGNNTNEIAVLKQRTSFTPSAAALDLLQRALEVHMTGAATYTDPFTRVTRWLVSTGLSLDTDGITINTTQRRALYGLGERLDKIYYFRTVAAANHMGFLVRNGGDQVWFGVDATTNVWQMYNPDESVGSAAGVKNVTHPDHPSGVPYVAGDIFGYQPETLPGGHLRIVPVIKRAAVDEPLQCNDVDFESANAAAHFDPDKIAIQTGNFISEVWVAQHTGLGASHDEIASADFTMAGLGFRVEGTGRDILTLSGDIEFTGGKFIVKEGALMIRKADGTTEVFTAGGEIPTATINAAIATYLADNPISPTQATVVQRDYNQATLQTAAAASLGGNTGLWVVANQQSGTQGIPVGNVSAGTGVTLPDAVNGIVNLPPGTLCRVRSGTDILVMFIPGSGGGGTAQTGLEIVELLEALTGNARLSATAIDGLAAIATSGAYSDLTGAPNLATVATSGSYNDLSNRPTIPVPTTDASDLISGTLPPARIGDNSIVEDKLAEAVRTKLNATGGAESINDLNDVDTSTNEPKNDDVLSWDGTNWVPSAPPSGGGGTDTNSYFIDVWVRTPKGATISSTPFTSPGTWNNNQSAPAFTAKPTENIAAGSVFDISDLPANAASTPSFDYHHFQRVFTVGETNVPNNAWKYIGLYTHSEAEPSTYLINAYLRLPIADVATATSLTSPGTWDDATKSFSTEPTHGTTGDVFDRSNLPADAARSTTNSYWEYERYFTVGETGVAASAWTLKGRINPAPATGGGASLAWTDLGLSATNTVGEVTVTSAQLTNRVELSVSYGTATANTGGTDDHDANGNNNKVFGTNINLSLIPAYTATNGWVQFGGFGRGANQFIIQAKRTETGDLTLEAVDNNTNSNSAIYAVWAR